MYIDWRSPPEVLLQSFSRSKAQVWSLRTEYDAPLGYLQLSTDRGSESFAWKDFPSVDHKDAGCSFDGEVASCSRRVSTGLLAVQSALFLS